MQDESLFALDMREATPSQIRAIEKKARRDGTSFEAAAKNMLLELADKTEKKRMLNPVARLFRSPWVH